MSKSPEQMTKTIEQALDYDQIMSNPNFGSGTSLQPIVDFMRNDISKFQESARNSFAARYKQTNKKPSDAEEKEFAEKLNKDSRNYLEDWKKVLIAGANKAPVPELESKALGDAATKGFMDNLLTLNPQLMLMGAFDGIKSAIGSLIVKMEPVQKFINTYTSYAYSHAAKFFGGNEEPLTMEQAGERAEETAMSLRLQEAVKKVVPAEQLTAFVSLAGATGDDVQKLQGTRSDIVTMPSLTTPQETPITSFEQLDKNKDGKLSADEFQPLNKNTSTENDKNTLIREEIPEAMKAQFDTMLKKQPQVEGKAPTSLDLGNLASPISLADFKAAEAKVASL
jgi:hypothetical protein